MTRILVTGATGHTGSLIVNELLNRGANVRALVRDEKQAEALRAKGAEVVIGDLDKPKTLPPAVDGVDRIYLTTWNGPTAEQQRKNLIDAAKAAGKPHVVMGGAYGPNSRITQQVDAADEYLKASGLPWTILKPTFFMQNVLAAKDTIAQGQLYWDLGDGKLPAIDIRDIADAAVSVLLGDPAKHAAKSYVLTGPRAISFHDMAATLSQELGHEVKYVPVPTDAAKQFMMGLGYTEWVADGFGELMAGFADDWGADRASDGVAKLAGHPPRSFQDFARDHRAYLEA